VLSLADVASLRSSIRASPSYIASYLNAGREKVFCRLALQQLDYPLRADALAAVRSARFYDKGAKEYQLPSIEAKRACMFIEEYGRAHRASA
jgi:hypothetical protein